MLAKQGIEQGEGRQITSTSFSSFWLILEHKVSKRYSFKDDVRKEWLPLWLQSVKETYVSKKKIRSRRKLDTYYFPGSLLSLLLFLSFAL
jgi:hypothetical protein